MGVLALAALKLVDKLFARARRRRSRALQKDLAWPVLPPGSTPVEVPSLGADVTFAVVARVNRSPGETVDVGDALLELETDKADVEIPSAIAGVVSAVFVREGDEVPVGFPVLAVNTDALLHG